MARAATARCGTQGGARIKGARDGNFNQFPQLATRVGAAQFIGRQLVPSANPEPRTPVRRPPPSNRTHAPIWKSTLRTSHAAPRLPEGNSPRVSTVSAVTPGNRVGDSSSPPAGWRQAVATPERWTMNLQGHRPGCGVERPQAGLLRLVCDTAALRSRGRSVDGSCAARDRRSRFAGRDAHGKSQPSPGGCALRLVATTQPRSREDGASRLALPDQQ